MSVSNRGKPEERELEAFFALMGKDADLYRFEDYAEANFKGTGRTRKIVAAKPSDYILTWQGETGYLEVKACADPQRFPLSNIRKEQWHRAKRVNMARGSYEFWIKSSTHGRWYRIYAGHLLAFRDQGKASVTWEELSKWDITDELEALKQQALAGQAK